MHAHRRSIRMAAPAWLLAMLLAQPGLVQAEPWVQPHVVKEGPFTLRVSTVRSMDIPAVAAKEHGIERAEQRGVLNVMVSEQTQQGPRNQYAKVHAIARNLTGLQREIPMREIVSNGQVTYLGTYDFVKGEVVDFVVEAAPRGAPRPLRLSFRDQLWPLK